MKFFTGVYKENEYGVMTISAHERINTYKERIEDLKRRIKKYENPVGLKYTLPKENLDGMKDMVVYYTKQLVELEEFVKN